MTPTTALWMILGITLLGAAAAAPLTYEFRAELARAKKNLSNYAAIGLMTFSLGLVSLALWWYYALTTDQVLLAVIPTVGVVWGWILRGVVRAGRSA